MTRPLERRSWNEWHFEWNGTGTERKIGDWNGTGTERKIADRNGTGTERKKETGTIWNGTIGKYSCLSFCLSVCSFFLSICLLTLCMSYFLRMLHSLLLKDRWTDKQADDQWDIYWNVVPERNDKQSRFCGTELERNEINVRNGYLERNGNLKGCSNGLMATKSDSTYSSVYYS